MPAIKVNTNLLRTYETDLQNIQGEVASIMNQFDSIKNHLDWDIRGEAGINSRLMAISRELSGEKSGIYGMKKFLNSAKSKYDLLENQNRDWIKKNVSAYESINDAYEETLPEGIRKLIEKLLKYWIKNSGAKGAEKILDVKAVIDDLIDGEYLDAVEDIMSLLDIKGWDFEDANLTSGIKGYLDKGINTGVLKAQAFIKTLKMTLDENGYIKKNDEKYMSEAEDRILSGDIPGGIAALPAEFIQTVGKGSVDVCCQMVSSLIDSVCNAATGGLMDLSTFNGMCEDVFGYSMGTLFNAATSAVSTVVDFCTDQILIEGASLTGKGIGKAVRAGIGGVQSGIKLLKSVF